MGVSLGGCPDLGPTSTPSEATASLGWAILNALEGPNVALSPSSLALTLAILTEGATGATLTDLNSLLGVGDDDRREAFAALRDPLEQYAGLPEHVDPQAPPVTPVAHQASQIATVTGLAPEPDFTKAVEEHYGATTASVPAAELVAVLDEWVSTHTAGLVRESAIQVGPTGGLVVQDAVLFASAWARPFTSSDEPLEFHSPGGTQQVPALSSLFTLAHVGTTHARAVRLPYDETLAMDVILPAEGLTPADIAAEELLEVHDLLSRAPVEPIVLTMPPADITAEAQILPILEGIGIDFRSGFDRIFPGAQIAQLVHQARLQVNAQGTVGAAVTEALMVTSAPMPGSEPKQMVVDRPYIMRILDASTGWPIFLAVVSDAAGAITEH